VDALEKTKQANLPLDLQAKCFAMGHRWGHHMNDVIEKNTGARFDVILAADCTWMTEQQRFLLESCAHLVQPNTGSVYLTCFPHQGTLNMKDFFLMANEMGFQVETMSGRLFTESILYHDSDGQRRFVEPEILNQVQSFELKLMK
jgi:hypothetical protein